MACEICGRGACTRCFHSLDEQERFDKKQEMSSDVDELREEIISLKEEIERMKNDARDNAFERDLNT